MITVDRIRTNGVEATMETNLGGGTLIVPEEAFLQELAELRHFRDTAVGLWCVDQDPKEKSLEWIREHAFQLT